MGSYINLSNYNRLLSDNYDPPFLRKCFKMPFAVSLVCM